MQRRFDWTGARVVFKYQVLDGNSRYVEWGLQDSSGEVGRISSFRGFPRVVEFSRFVRVPLLQPQWPIPTTSGAPEARRAVGVAVTALRLIYSGRRWRAGEPTVTSVTPLDWPRGASPKSPPTSSPPEPHVIEVKLTLPPTLIMGASRAEVRVFPDEGAVWRVLVPELGRRG